jgi:hypothetical protein
MPYNVFNRSRMQPQMAIPGGSMRQGIVTPYRMGPDQTVVDGGSMRDNIVSTPTMREALVQTQPQQSVAEILSEPLGEVSPNLGRVSSEASRQRQIADMLLQGANSRQATDLVTGFSKLGEAFIARNAGKRADEAEDKAQSVQSALMQQAMQTTPEGKAAYAQLLATKPDAGMEAIAAAQAPQKPRDPLVINNRAVNPDNPSEVYADYSDPAPVAETYEDYVPDGAPGGYYQRNTVTGQVERVAGPERAPENGVTVLPDGTIMVGGPAGGGSIFGKTGDSAGASLFSGALEDADVTDTTLGYFNRAEAILNSGYDTGALAEIRGNTGAIANDLGFTVPGWSSDKSVGDYEEFNTINKQLAANMLKLFGGSDTERELAIAITSNIGPRMANETNRRMIANGKRLIEIQRAKPEYIAQWTRRWQSVDAINPETGLGFQATWDRYLEEQAGGLTGAANTSRQVAVEGAATGWTQDKEARRLALEAMLNGGK